MSLLLVGLSLGFALGTSLQLSMLVRERKNTRLALLALLEGGPFQLLYANGQPVSCASLLASLDATLKLPSPRSGVSRTRLAAIACAGAFTGAAVALVVISRFG